MKHLHVAFLVAATCAAACSNSKADKPSVKGSPDWDGDPRPLGACVGTVKPGVDAPPGPRSFCLENQSATECKGSTANMDWVYAEHETCASRGYAKQCNVPKFPTSTRFKECPTAAAEAPAAPASPNLEAGKQAVALMQDGVKAADELGSDCTKLGERLNVIRKQLWDLGKAHPSLFRNMTDAELKQVHAADAMEAVADRLPRCKDNAHAKEFMYAITKLM